MDNNLRSVCDYLDQWGADTKAGLRRVLEDKDFYYKLLLEFSQDDALRRLENAIDNSEWQQAFVIAHDLKGAALSLGLLPLIRTISAVVEDLRSEVRPTLTDDLGKFQRQWQQYQKIIQSWTVTPTAEGEGDDRISSQKLVIPDFCHDLPVVYVIYRSVLKPDTSIPEDLLYLDMSDAYCKLIGRERKKLIGHTHSEVFGSVDPSWIEYASRASVYRRKSDSHYFDRLTDRWYHLTVAPIGIPGCSVFSFQPVEDTQSDRKALLRNQNTDKLILQICRTLDMDADYSRAMQRVLEELSHVIHPDRIYIVEKKGPLIRNSFEWCAPGVEPLLKKLGSKVNPEISRGWGIENGSPHLSLVEDIEELRDRFPVNYQIMKKEGIRNMMTVPFYSGGEAIGLMGIHNFTPSETVDIRKVMQNVAFFISVKVSNHILMDRLEDLKKYDKTTGAKKREDMLKCLQRIQTRDQSAGIIYCNLNSMKEINDRQGFMGGDEVLRRAVQVLSDLFGRQNIYRIGGDEFLALISEKSEEKFLDMVRSLRELQTDPATPSMAIGSAWVSHGMEVKAGIRKADQAMQEDKRKYQMSHRMA
ncbi:MAG: diguanylate cyclase [Lachnospiraceae bacterium]|nr:diguanylate cyclase [Lachnospiraceae bacterium]